MRGRNKDSLLAIETRDNIQSVEVPDGLVRGQNVVHTLLKVPVVKKNKQLLTSSTFHVFVE